MSFSDGSTTSGSSVSTVAAAGCLDVGPAVDTDRGICSVVVSEDACSGMEGASVTSPTLVVCALASVVFGLLPIEAILVVS